MVLSCGGAESINTMPTTAFFPSSPEQASANAMLASRKQQLAHLQTLQRQQQQVLQQMSVAGVASPMSSMMSGYAEGRNDQYSSSGLRSAQVSPGAGSQGGVSFATPHQQLVSPRRTTFECDYDTNPTELYLAVQRKDWEGAVDRVVACPQEASTWVSRKEADGKLRWRLLPLHAAIIFRAPEKTISALLGAFSQGAACKDDQGMLPLHLAFRNGCDEDSVNLLLMAHPQSIDVQDRKGRTPLVLAQNSTHANRDMYISALEKGPAYYAVASAAKDGHALVVPEMPPTYQSYQMPMLMAPSPMHMAPSPMHWSSNASVDPAMTAQPKFTTTATGSDRLIELESELAKTQETSQILVDHVNALEAQLASRTDTERFLATKIANLDSQVKATNAMLEEAKAEVQTKNMELAKKDEDAAEQAKEVEKQIAELNDKIEDKKSAELRTYKLTNKERYDLEERVEVSERECAAAQANAAVLEAQLRKKIETEQSLASQVSMLASQLASSASTSSESVTAYQRQCEALTAENKKLQSQIERLEGKLGTVATALDAMAAEQERIVEAASKHEKTMAACTQVHQTIIADTTRQETLLEEAAKEREQIVSILMRQAEDAEQTMSDRERLLEAVKGQEADIARAAEERDAVIKSVSKQREYMDFMLNGELQFLKRTASEDKCELVKEEKMSAMHSAMEEFAKVGGNVVESEVIDEVESNDDELDEAALAEAADAIKEAMRTANGFVNNSAEGSAEDEEDDESEEEADEADIDAAINDASTDEDSDEE